MSIAGQTQYCTNGRSFDSNYITSTLDILKKNVEQLHNEIEKKAAPYIDLYGRAQECHQKIEIVLQKYQDIFPSTFFQRLKSRVQDVLCRRIGYMTSYIQHHHVKTQIEKRQRSVSLLISRLTLHSEEIEIQKKWRKLGLPDAVLVQAPQLAKFLYKTGDMFSFIGFSQGQKAEKAAFQTKDDGSVAILYKGEYVDINYFSSCVQYDTAKNQLILKDSQTPLLYVAPPRGFIELCREQATTLCYVDQLSQEEFTKVKLHAAQFKNHNSNPNTICGVLQICTRPGKGNGFDMPQMFYKDGNIENIPSHYFFRIIDDEGKVFSFGAVPSCQVSWKNIAAKVPGTVSHLDYMEFRKNTLWVTSVPIMETAVLQQLFEEIKNNSKVFNFLKNNCTTLVNTMLKITGEEVSIRMKIEECLLMMSIKPIQSLPLVGKISVLFSQVITWSTKACSYVAPSCVKKVFFVLSYCRKKVQDHTLGVIKTAISFFFGSAKIHPRLVQEEYISKTVTEKYKAVVASWRDWFNVQTTDIDVGINLLAWQKNQITTQLFCDNAACLPRFHILRALE